MLNKIANLLKAIQNLQALKYHCTFASVVWASGTDNEVGADNDVF